MRWRHAPLFVLLLVSAACIAVAEIFWPRATAAGWLIAFVYVSAVPLGSLALLMIHRLTGGHWGDALRGFLEPSAACLPLLALLFVPILIALPVLFPWVADPSRVKVDVGLFYLNSPLFIARAVIAFVGWSMLAMLLPRAAGKGGTLLAAVGLIFYAVAISLVSVDWMLSIEPAFISTSFGASVAIMQLLAALAFVALAAPLPDRSTVRDLGGLMLAVVLGLTYIDFMAVLVIWYSDLPDKVDWFVERAAPPWSWLALVGFVFCSAIPILALLLSRVRASRAALRALGASILFGLAAYDAYLLAPPYGAWALAAAFPSLVLLTTAAILFAHFGASARLLGTTTTAHD